MSKKNKKVIEDITSYQVTIQRAIQVAIVGDFKIYCYSQKWDYSTFGLPIPHLDLPYLISIMPEDIKEYFILNPKDNGGKIAINSEVGLSPDDLFKKEIYSNWKQDALALKGSDLSKVEYNPTTAMNLILKTAIERLAIPLELVDNLIEVSKAIAILGKRDFVKIEDIAEAIQWMQVPKWEYLVDFQTLDMLDNFFADDVDFHEKLLKFKRYVWNDGK